MSNRSADFFCARRTPQDLYKIYHILLNAFGPQGWWPGKTRFEVIAGAILTQNTAWSNVEKAITNLRRARLLNLKALLNVPIRRLYPLIRATGYYRIKSSRLKAIINFLYNNYRGNLNRFFREPLEKARKELLSVKGVGPETADSILLYAGQKSIFVVDAYTRRIFGHAGILQNSAGYEYIQKLFMENLPRDTMVYNEYHALIVRLGKEICRKKPQCSICPLNNRISSYVNRIESRNTKYGIRNAEQNG